MNARTASHALRFEFQRILSRPASTPRANAAMPESSGWLERLAAWADRKPIHHHRVGSWDLARLG